jgi:tripartite-type tricarboxylate transporter receptor subunit TctC
LFPGSVRLRPAGIPRETAGHLTRSFVALMKLPELAQRLLELGYSPAPLGGEPFRQFLREQVESWRIKIKEVGIEQE